MKHLEPLGLLRKTDQRDTPPLPPPFPRVLLPSAEPEGQWAALLQPARPGPGPGAKPPWEDSRSHRPRGEPGGGAGAPAGTARGGAVPESAAGSGDPRVPERLSVRQPVVLRQPGLNPTPHAHSTP